MMFQPHIDGVANPVEIEFSLEQQLIQKRRVVAFLAAWEMVLGINFFLDSVANSFVEVYISGRRVRIVSGDVLQRY